MSEPKNPDSTSPSASSGGPAGPSETPTVEFEELAKGNRIIHIVYGDAVYELRLTRNGRLVLSK